MNWNLNLASLDQHIRVVKIVIVKKNVISCFLYFQVGISCCNTIKYLCESFQNIWGGGIRIGNDQ